MLRLREKTLDDRGYYRQGVYSLRISPIEDGSIVIDANRAVDNFQFAPNPTDLDDTMQFANTVQADHANGYYVDVNELGMKTISIRGITGQKPKMHVADRVLGSSALTNSGIPYFDTGDGYTIWQQLYNFFVAWANAIRERPHGYALMFVNTKDAEIYQVVPMTVRKVRTSARPLTYGYAIDLQVLGEADARDETPSWLERMDDIRSRVKSWQNTINQTLILAANLLNDVALYTVGSVFGPITSTLTQLNNGLQGFGFTAQKINRYGAYSHDRLKAVAEELANSAKIDEGQNAVTKTLTDTNIPAGSIPGVYPPTADACYTSLVPPAEIILRTGVQALSENAVVDEGIRSNLDLDSPNLETYGDALRMLQLVYLTVDSAPLPNSTPAGNASSESKDLHRVVRAGSAGDVIGREDVLASAALAGETDLLEDTVIGTETRHAVRRQKTIETYTLSHLATIVLRDWARSNNDRISPQLNSFRKWFLGMRDPSSFSTVYKNVEVSSTDTIYSLASRYLGSWERWAEIALVNGLKYPYISRQGGAYQKAPGEEIAIPVEDAKVPVEVVEDLIQITKTHDLLTTQQLFLGFDVEISGVSGDMVYSVYDVAHLAGLQAFRQELSLVIEGRGGVTPDRSAGPVIKIGSRSRGRQSIDLWQAVLKLWFSQDPRVNEVVWVRVEQRGDVVQFSSKLKFENFDSATTVAGELRS